MLNLSDVIHGLKNPDTKASLAALKDVSPEALLKDLIGAYEIAQKNHNTAQEQTESPNFLNTIVRIEKQPVVLDENQGLVYQDDVITLRLRNFFNVERVAGITETVKGVL